MKPKKVLAILIAVQILLGTGHGYLFAGASKDYAGTASAQFLKLGAGARASGMGEANIAVSDDANSVYWNPANLVMINGQSLSFMHVTWLADTSYDWFSYSKNLGAKGAFGLGVQYLNYGDIVETDIIGSKKGTYNPNDLALIASYARNVKGIMAGINAKYISSKIKETASAFAIDAGATKKFMNNDLALSFVMQNLGTGMKFVRKENELPAALKAGASYNILSNIIVASDMTIPNDNAPYMAVGAELTHKLFAWRVGYNTRSSELGGISGLSIGLGIAYNDFQFDYCFQGYDYLGNTHRFSVTWESFGTEKRQRLNAVHFYPENNTFSPNGDETRDIMVFVRLENKVAGVKSWEFIIQDPRKNIVKKYSGKGEIPERITWEGDNESGDKLIEGEYRYTFATSGGFLSNPTRTHGNFIIDLSPPRIDIEVSAKNLNLGDEKNYAPLKIIILCDDKSGIERWEMEITDSKDKVIKKSEHRVSGDVMEWDARDYVMKSRNESKEYTVKVVCYDKVGNRGWNYAKISVSGLTFSK